METFWEVFRLVDYNTRLVVLSTTLLGLSSGVVGSFLLLRGRSLMGDAISHACLPGIALAFGGMVWWGGSGKELGGLLAGATVTGMAGAGAVLLIRRLPRMREDTALGIVLSVFYGLGVVLLGLVQELPGASSAGLESFIYGKTASLLWSDFLLLMSLALVVLVVCAGFFKELEMLCFDEGFAASAGWAVGKLDVLLLVLCCVVTVAGLQAVGLILIIAFLVIPAAAARMWSRRLRGMVVLAGLLGALSGWVGSSLSALSPGLPAGAVIVLVAAFIFVISLLLGTERGLLVMWVRPWWFRRSLRPWREEGGLNPVSERGEG